MNTKLCHFTVKRIVKGFISILKSLRKKIVVATWSLIDRKILVQKKFDRSTVKLVGN